MSSTQSKFIALLTAAVESRGLELVQNSEWSNTGVLRVEKADAFRSLLSIRYNFQSGYATFDVTDDSGLDFAFVRYDEMDAFISRVLAKLPAVKKAARRTR